MYRELLILFKKNCDIAIEQSKTISQKSLKFEMESAKQTTSIDTPLKLEVNIRLLGLAKSEVRNSV